MNRSYRIHRINLKNLNKTIPNSSNKINNNNYKMIKRQMSKRIMIKLKLTKSRMNNIKMNNKIIRQISEK